MQINFPHYKQTIQCDPPCRVDEACAAAGHPLDRVCAGKGTCGQCRVLVREKGLTLEVLGCQYPASDGMAILISDDGRERQILTQSVQTDPLDFDPPVTCYPMVIGALNFSSAPAFLASMDQILPISLGCSDELALHQWYDAIRACPAPIVNAIVQGDDLIGLSADDEPLEALGLAFDVGTTTIAGYLYDLVDGACLATASAQNGQTAFGGDVISRIQAASEGQMKPLRNALFATLGGLVRDLCRQTGRRPEAIIHAVYAGNTTMLHFLTGRDPSALGRAPFVSAVQGPVDFDFPAEAGRHSSASPAFHPACRHHTLPPLGGFVGSDTTALLAALPQKPGIRLVIDLGTNGEIALGDGQRYTVASTACGPALEGAGLTMGMRGTDGAIEAVTYPDGPFDCRVIGGGPALGLCGSGIVDAIAALLDAGILRPDGAFLPEDDLTGETGVPHPLANRFGHTADGVRCFTLLSPEENPGGPAIVLTQKDIRAVQLAKAAIQAATLCLMEASGYTPDAVPDLYLAGAFGNYIRVASAQKLGLIPAWPGTAVHPVGNGAGAGAVRCLLSQSEIARCEAIPCSTRHLALTETPSFNDHFIRCTRFESF